MKRILVGFDGSEGSENALNKAMMVIDENGKLILLAVVPVPSDKNLVDQTAYELLKKRAHNLINTVVNDMGSHEFEVIGMVEEGDIAAKIIDGNKVHDDVRMIVTPASQEIWLKIAKTGIAEILINAGAIICNPNCGACFGAHQGMLAPGENCISSSNRNFQGRMGAESAGIYLASPAAVAASAIKGVITDPREF